MHNRGFLVSHPTKQANIYDRAVAAQLTGLPVVFLTGLYGEHLPTYLKLAGVVSKRIAETTRRLKAKRIHDKLLPDNVISVSPCWIEIAKLWLGRSSSGFTPWMRLLSRYQDSAHDRAVAKWLRASHSHERYRVFHGFQGSCLYSLAAARALGLRTVYEITSPPIRYESMANSNAYLSADEINIFARQNRQKLDAIAREALSADTIVVQSKYTLEFIEALGIANKDVRLLDLGVDEIHYSPLASCSFQRSKSLKCLFVGQVGYRKGSDLLAIALNPLREKRIEVTAAGYVVDEVGERCRNGSAADGITYLGPVSDSKLLELYQKSDLLVIPSRTEGGCNVVMEALSCGCPCLVSEAAVSVVEDEKSGWIVNSANIEQLRAKLSILASNPSLVRSLRGSSRARALDYTWDKFHRRLSDIYRDLVIK